MTTIPTTTELKPRTGVTWNTNSGAYHVQFRGKFLGTYPKDCLDLANDHRLEAEHAPESEWPAIKDKYTTLKRERGVKPGTYRRMVNVQAQQVEAEPESDFYDPGDPPSSALAISDRRIGTADERRRKVEYTVGIHIQDADAAIGMLPFLIEQALTAERQVAASTRELIAARCESDKRWDAVSRALLNIESPGLRDSLMALLNAESSDVVKAVRS